MKKQLLTAGLAGLLSASAIMTAFATSGGATPEAHGTDIYAGVMLNDPNATIDVVVPSLYAFVVHGTTDSTRTDPITNISKPNILVTVDDTPTTALPGPNFNYGLTTDQDGVIDFTNKSTMAKDDPSNTGENRQGIPVTVKGYIENTGSLASRNYWEHVGNAATLAGNTAGFKKYTITINGVPFNQAMAGGKFEMATEIPIGAPDLQWNTTTNRFDNYDSSTNTARQGAVVAGTFDVAVGGQLGQYNRVERSAKVGSVVWRITHLQTNDGTVPTAPGNDYSPNPL